MPGRTVPATSVTVLGPPVLARSIWPPLSTSRPPPPRCRASTSCRADRPVGGGVPRQVPVSIRPHRAARLLLLRGHPPRCPRTQAATGCPASLPRPLPRREVPHPASSSIFTWPPPLRLRDGGSRGIGSRGGWGSGGVAEAKVGGDREEEEEKGGGSESGSGSDEDDSDGSGSDDSEEERRREEERRWRRAERLTAMAARAITEREEAVAKLEGEKASLEKLLAEREKEQVQEIHHLLG